MTDEQNCDCCDQCCCCEICECDTCSPPPEEDQDAPPKRSWFRRYVVPLLPALIILGLMIGFIAYQNRSDDYTITAIVGYKSRKDLSKSPFESSNDYEYTIKMEMAPRNESSDTNFHGRVDIWFHGNITREQFERLHQDKWYKVRIRFSPNGIRNNFELLDILEGPLSAPVEK